MIEILNLGVNNLRSIVAAVEETSKVKVTVIDRADQSAEPRFLVLPGTGSFGHAMGAMAEREFPKLVDDSVHGSGVPILGVCLGMQLMAASSAETPGISGLGLISRPVKRLQSRAPWRVPHVGWNTAFPSEPRTHWLHELGSRDYYFSHSYFLEPDPGFISLNTLHGEQTIVAAFSTVGGISGAQFHPEKSSKNGFAFLQRLFGEFL